MLASPALDRWLQAAEVRTGAMVVLIPADPEDLAVEGGEPAGELHTTLLYLGKAADIPAEARADIVERLTELAALAPDHVHGDAFAVSMFNPTGEEPCVVLGLSGGDLAELHAVVVDVVYAAVDEAFEIPDQHEPWIPHITLAYTDDPTRLGELVDRTGEVMFDRIRVAFAGENIDIPLGAVTESMSPALARWLEHGTHNQKSHGRRYKIAGDKTSGILPSIADLRKLAEDKGVTVPKRARKADIAKMLDDAGPRETAPKKPGRKQTWSDEALAAKAAQDARVRAATKDRIDADIDETIRLQRLYRPDAASGPTEPESAKDALKRFRSGARRGDVSDMTDDDLRKAFTAAKYPSDDRDLIRAELKLRGEGIGGYREPDDLFPGRPRQGEKLDAKLDAAFGPAKLTDEQIQRQKVDAAKTDIRAAIPRLEREPGAWVGLARLRDELGERHNRHDVDQALTELSVDPDVAIVPEDNQKVLRQVDRDAEVVIGNQRQHVIAITPPLDEGSHDRVRTGGVRSASDEDLEHARRDTRTRFELYDEIRAEQKRRAGSSTADAVRQATQLSDTTGRPSGLARATGRAELRRQRKP